jgi:hypothetical protein
MSLEARVTGVAFFDFDHGQTGVAPNSKSISDVFQDSDADKDAVGEDDDGD